MGVFALVMLRGVGLHTHLPSPRVAVFAMVSAAAGLLLAGCSRSTSHDLSSLPSVSRSLHSPRGRLVSSRLLTPVFCASLPWQMAHIARENRMDKLEQQVRDALFSRTTAHLGEHRILKTAFTKFDKVPRRWRPVALTPLSRPHSGFNMTENDTCQRSRARSRTALPQDASGSVDVHEFAKALEYLGLHTAEGGLPGVGGLPMDVVTGLFERYDNDNSGHVDYEEFCGAILKENTKMTKMT